MMRQMTIMPAVPGMLAGAAHTHTSMSIVLRSSYDTLGFWAIHGQYAASVEGNVHCK